MSNYERRKGSVFEAWVAAMFRIVGFEVEMGDQAGRHNVTAPDREAKRWFSIECKAGQHINVWAALDQSMRRCVPGTRPIVVSKSQRRGKLPIIAVTLDLNLFLAIVRIARVEKVAKGDDRCPIPLPIMSSATDEENAAKVSQMLGEEECPVSRRV